MEAGTRLDWLATYARAVDLARWLNLTPSLSMSLLLRAWRTPETLAMLLCSQGFRGSRSETCIAPKQSEYLFWNVLRSGKMPF